MRIRSLLYMRLIGALATCFMVAAPQQAQTLLTSATRTERAGAEVGPSVGTDGRARQREKIGDGGETMQLERNKLNQSPQLGVLYGEPARAYPDEVHKATSAEEIRKAAGEPEAALLPLPSFTSRKSTPLSVAYLDVFGILRERNSCSDFYGGAAALRVFNDFAPRLKETYLNINVGIRMSGPINNVLIVTSGQSYRLFEKAEINRNGPFYKRKIFPSDRFIPYLGGYPPDSREVRALILLHELGHLIKGADGNWLLPNDGNDEIQSSKNTEMVLVRCRAQIEGLKRNLSVPTFLQPEVQTSEPIPPGRK